MISTSPLSRFEVHVGLIQSLGMTREGERRVVPITGGQASGKLAGSISALGQDWQWMRTDGVCELAAHYMLRTADDDLIEVHSNGLRHGPAEVMQRLSKGEFVDPDAYYFRCAMRFTTASKQWARLNNVLAVGIGERKTASVILRVFELL
jgi:Protein of unknown function (DUF3237)